MFRASSRRGLATAAGATLGMASGFGCLVLSSVFMAPLAADLGWSRSEVSLGYACATLGMALGGLVWGRVCDRADIRVLLALGGVFMVLPLLALAGATRLWHYQAAHLMLGGLGFGCLYPCLLAAAGDWFAARRGLVIGVVTAGGAAGQGVLPYAAEALIGAAGWRGAFVALAGVIALVQVAVYLAVRRKDAPADGGAGGGAPRLRLLAAPRLLVLSAAAFLCCACMGMPLIHLAGHVASVCGSTAAGASTLLVAMAFGAGGRVAFGAIADRLGNLRAYAGASAIQTLTLLAFPVLQDQASILALSAVFGFGFAGNMTCLILCIRDEVPAAGFGSAIGFVMLVAWAGMGLGGWLGGAVFDATGGYGPAFLIAAAFGAGNLVLLALLGMPRAGLRRARVAPA